ncbi:hypothetical protein SCHPADRAFT_189626 [Schizopora paradoxa]|uniref:Uncharacterized protein n=1 Tax=Schizopora paradoxa TaxID=27342 RepID=A0A0H2S5M6_9AGAM|nr:hypothetical protein SCHPADRAFT_189626 [Schizopora paradoxa]
MAIALTGQRIHFALTHGAGRFSYGLYKRLRNANLPLLVAFLGALVMFVRALSGAGFEGGAMGESRWARLRSGVADTLWRCPALNEDLSNSTQSGTAYTPGCLKAKLQNAVRARTLLLDGKVIAKDSSDFEIPNLPSLLHVPSSLTQLPHESSELPSISHDSESDVSSPTDIPNETPPPIDDGAKQVVEEERPRANWPSKHGDGSRGGFELRRRPH